MIKLKYILALFFIFSFVGCSGNSGNWGWYVIDPTTKLGLSNIKFLIGGFGATILLSVIAAFMSIILGLIVALPSFSNNFFFLYRKLFNFSINSIIKNMDFVTINCDSIKELSFYIFTYTKYSSTFF